MAFLAAYMTIFFISTTFLDPSWPIHVCYALL